MELKPLVIDKLSMLAESDFESWFNRNTKDVGNLLKTGKHIRDYENAGQRGESPDLRMKHPESSGFGYQGGAGKKKQK